MGQINDLEPKKVTEKINPFSFKIDLDSREFDDYTINGVVENIKVPKEVSYHDWATSFKNPVASTADGMLPVPDLAKFGRGEQLHCALGGIILFCEMNQRLPGLEDAETVMGYAKDFLEKSEVETELEDEVVKNAVSFAGCSISPIAAFFGGIVA